VAERGGPAGQDRLHRRPVHLQERLEQDPRDGPDHGRGTSHLGRALDPGQRRRAAGHRQLEAAMGRQLAALSERTADLRPGPGLGLARIGLCRGLRGIQADVHPGDPRPAE
ncbi:hypothetical protein LTR94_034657, partial [Friedmanniomyces endolithicus]